MQQLLGVLPGMNFAPVNEAHQQSSFVTHVVSGPVSAIEMLTGAGFVNVKI
jgi:hypothetical protein